MLWARKSDDSSFAKLGVTIIGVITSTCSSTRCGASEAKGPVLVLLKILGDALRRENLDHLVKFIGLIIFDLGVGGCWGRPRGPKGDYKGIIGSVIIGDNECTEEDNLKVPWKGTSKTSLVYGHEANLAASQTRGGGKSGQVLT